MRIRQAAAFAVAMLSAGAARAEDEASRLPPADRRGPYTAILGAEASVVGLSFGPRAELLWRPGAAGTVSHLRTTVGALAGPELVFVPIGVGYRAVFREQKALRPFAGAGYEAHFFLTDGPAYAQWAAIYVEGGASLAIVDRFSLGLGTSLDWTVAGERGPGLQGRLFGAYQF